ncbi:hypothetical protein [Actinacidiphila sp. bgisy160]|uniref:hypothetical protein n=1 Tax=Actinacidiphila sp. bgisy160 TaxID=3413796 RepID=UPI003D73234D
MTDEYGRRVPALPGAAKAWFDAYQRAAEAANGGIDWSELSSARLPNPAAVPPCPVCGDVPVSGKLTGHTGYCPFQPCPPKTGAHLHFQPCGCLLDLPSLEELIRSMYGTRENA